MLTLGTPFVHSLTYLADVVYKIIKLVSFSHFWMDKEEEKSSLKERLAEAGQDLLKIVTGPIAIVGLELAAIYGMITPYNGRKLYASIERAQHGGAILAACFQPDPQCHTFGGSPDECGVL